MEAPSCIWRLILPGPDQLMPHKTKENLKRLSVYKRKSLGLELKKKEHAKQHCFLQMFRAARSFDHSSSLRNWLATAFSLARQFLSRIHLQQVATHTHWTSLEATVSEFQQEKSSRLKYESALVVAHVLVFSTFLKQHHKSGCCRG